MKPIAKSLFRSPCIAINYSFRVRVATVGFLCCFLLLLAFMLLLHLNYHLRPALLTGRKRYKIGVAAFSAGLWISTALSISYSVIETFLRNKENSMTEEQLDVVLDNELVQL